jgi:hypothetical protein
MTMMSRIFFLTLIFCSLINAAPTQPPFLGVYSVDVAVKEVIKNPESSKSFTIDSDRFFSFFCMSRSFQDISPNGQSSTHACSRFLTEHCKTLSQAKRARKTSIITCNLSFPDEDFSCAIKLIARKVDSQLLATFTIFIPKKNDPEITAALINFCNAAIPRLSFMQKHSRKMYTSLVAMAFLGAGTLLESHHEAKVQRRMQAEAAAKKRRMQAEAAAKELRMQDEAKVKAPAYFAKEIHPDAETIKKNLIKKNSCAECQGKDQCSKCHENDEFCRICGEKFCDSEAEDICVLGHMLSDKLQAHSFHYTCIYTWMTTAKQEPYIIGGNFQAQKAKCPLCSAEG